MQDTEQPSTVATPEADAEPNAHYPRRTLFLISGLLLGSLLCLFGWWLTTAPNYQGERSVSVVPGQTVAGIVADVAATGAVRSETLLYVLTQTQHREETIKTGTYVFTSEQDVFSVAAELMQTTPADELVVVTFPEGITAAAMAAIAAEQLTAFSPEVFWRLASSSEGRLWPETYFVPVTYTAAELYDLLRSKHDETLAPLAARIQEHPLTEQEVLTLASIVEREANSEESMRMVAGILLNRLNADMPLQADASIEYVLDTPLNELPPGALAENLRAVDSPYNTYKIIGLPPTPIANPGLQAIQAVLDPLESDNYFYLTTPDGTFYYAETYEQHRVNIARYLR